MIGHERCLQVAAINSASNTSLVSVPSLSKRSKILSGSFLRMKDKYAKDCNISETRECFGSLETSLHTF